MMAAVRSGYLSHHIETFITKIVPALLYFFLNYNDFLPYIQYTKRFELDSGSSSHADKL